MHRARLLSLPAVLSLALAAGCTSENRGKLEGTRWVSEPATVKVKAGPAGAPQSVHVPAGYLELDFHEDGSFYYILKGKIHTGKYTLGPGHMVTLNLDTPVAGMKTHTEKIVVEGERMTMTDTDGTSIPFRKQ